MKTGRQKTADATTRLGIAIDRMSPVPLYHQFAQQLEQAIEHGLLLPGTLLGNEIDLAGRLGLSRPTVRQGIKALVEKGLLVRSRGVGTRVVHNTVKRSLELTSLYDDLAEAGQEPSTRVVRNDVVPASAEAAAALGIGTGDNVVYLERIRYANGLPVAVLRNHLPTGLLPDLGTDMLEATGLYRLLHAAGISLHSGHQTIGARAATAEDGEHLGEPEGAPLLTLRRTAYDAAGEAVEYGTHLYNAARYVFELQLLMRQ
ncbi:GntR family transcriptional regulator [Streptomyces sp. NBC_00038]|uniref:GntR family transcriptional regulator n=1 Tax=Streptomyces sp. NBC_00038 TaxID=2903615 RepID=UPI0022539716|nr:GntR family transcriptional regulator [Streptomyces sp. NBC_00038]MCX5563455.1 GntR family transcriptional regulator [Streptomyces sp. NBC_00038]